LFFSHLSFAYDFMPFDMNTRKVIEKRYIDQPLIISFWSIDCPYCIDDLKKLGKALSKNTNVQLITVCVDGKESAKKAERILSQANLPKHEQYQYAEVMKIDLDITLIQHGTVSFREHTFMTRHTKSLL